MGDQAHPSRGHAALNRRVADDLVWARWAVAQWDAFPAERQPRPLVLAGERAFVEQGFATGEAQLAYLDGRVESAGSVPAPVLAALMQELGTGRRSKRAGPPLVITDAVRAKTEFVTDRGRRQLPAWRLKAIAVLGPIWVLDRELAPGEWQPPEPPAIPRPALRTPRFDPDVRIVVGADASLTLHFTGALREYERYAEAEIIESDKAVAIVPKAEDIGASSAWRSRGHGHQISVQLESPIGARVFVDLHGHARQVLQPSSDPR